MVNTYMTLFPIAKGVIDRGALYSSNLKKSYTCPHIFCNLSLQWSAVRVTSSGNPRDLNFSRIVAGITKWFWVTIEGYFSYLLRKFEDLIPTSLGDITI